MGKPLANVDRVHHETQSRLVGFRAISTVSLTTPTSTSEGTGSHLAGLQRQWEAQLGGVQRRNLFARDDVPHRWNQTFSTKVDVPRLWS